MEHALGGTRNGNYVLACTGCESAGSSRDGGCEAHGGYGTGPWLVFGGITGSCVVDNVLDCRDGGAMDALVRKDETRGLNAPGALLDSWFFWSDYCGGFVIESTSSARSRSDSLISPRSTKPSSITASRMVIDFSTECFAIFAAAS